MDKFRVLIIIILIPVLGCTYRPKTFTEIEIIGYHLLTYDSTFSSNKDSKFSSYEDNTVILRMLSGYYATIDVKGNCKYTGHFHETPEQPLVRFFRQFKIDKKKFAFFLQNIDSITKDTCIFKSDVLGHAYPIRFIYKANDNKKVISTELGWGKNFYVDFYNYIDSCARKSNSKLQDTSSILIKRNKLITQISNNKFPFCYFMDPTIWI
jgi:hypothetical protein